MSFLFSKPKFPVVQPLPAVPKKLTEESDDDELKRKEAEERARLRRRQGRSSTILSRAGGFNSAFVARKSLLGGNQ